MTIFFCITSLFHEMSYYPIDGELQKKIVQKLEFNDLYNPEGLYPHQEFVRRYLSPYTPYKGLLIFHSLGSGKSLICISVAVDHYLHDGKRCLIITKGASGRENFKKEISNYYEMGKFSAKNFPDIPGTKMLFREYWKIFVLNHYMALHNSIRTMTDRDIVEQYSNMIFIFDEIHNVRKLGVGEEKRNDERLHVYDSLQRIVRLAKNVKVILATATPMTNDVGQLTSTIELLSDGSYDGIVSYNSEIKDKPKKIFHGSRGYLTDTKVYISQMEGHQRKYHIAEGKKGVPKDIYRMLTHVSLFAFPGEELYGKNIYTNGIMVPVKTSREIITVGTKTKKKITYTMYKVIDKYRKYLIGDALRKCSSKYWELMDILENKYPKVGPIFVFVEEVKGSGLLLLANIFEAHGYELYIGQNFDGIGKGKRFTICVGDQSVAPNQPDRLHGFNHERNVNGEYVRVLIGSKVVGESITLRNVRMFHVMTIHWNDSTIEQAVGRVVRSGSHNQLEKSQRKVDIYIHAAVCNGSDADGTDMYKLAICNEKQRAILKMEEKLKRCAVDRYITQKKSSRRYIPSSDPDTFVLYYMERYATVLIPKLERMLEKFFRNGNSASVDSILTYVGEQGSKVVLEVISRVITSNIRILGGRYLREDFGNFFLTNDPSTPFFFIRDREMKELKESKPKYDIPLYRSKAKISDTVDYLRKLQKMPFVERVSFVEKYVERKRIVPRIFAGLFTRYRGKLCHIMCYRAPGEAYTAVLPIPKQDVLELRTRVLEENGWIYVENAKEEAKIILKMEGEYDEMMSKIDQSEEVFLVISLIDGKPRIRTRFLEETNKGSTDKRYIRKGRSLASILKPTLGIMYAYICEIFGESGVKIGKNLRKKYLPIADKCVKPYGFSSAKEFAKSHPVAFSKFANMMENNSVSQLVEEMVGLMMEKRKCIFL